MIFICSNALQSGNHLVNLFPILILIIIPWSIWFLAWKHSCRYIFPLWKCKVQGPFILYIIYKITSIYLFFWATYIQYIQYIKGTKWANGTSWIYPQAPLQKLEDRSNSTQDQLLNERAGQGEYTLELHFKNLKITQTRLKIK